MTDPARGGSGEVPENPDTRWQRLRGYLMGLFVRAGAKREEAEDLAQETLARVFAKPRHFPMPQFLVSFAEKVARNLWVDEVRRRKRRAPVHGFGEPDGDFIGDVCMSPSVEPSETATILEDTARLRGALEQLMPIHREVLDLVVFQGLAYEEAAARLGVPRGTIKSRVHYAVRFLRQTVAGQDQDLTLSDRAEP
jgi:RNA polymerase sigma-70 factor, ECF subfamily